MMQPLRIALLLATLGAAQAQAGVFDDDEARRQIKDLSIKTEGRLDQQGKAQLDLANQLSRQAEEIARLRGQVETLGYELETAKKRQQDFYLDLDSRLRKLEPQAGGTAAVDPAAAPNTAAGADPARESREYEAALNQFKERKYKEPAGGFSAFVQKYPDSTLAPNAQFWLGNAWIAQRDCKRAIEAHGVVTTKYTASSRAPDAWLAIAGCQEEMGNAAGAKRSYETVIAKYPTSNAASTAQQKLKKK
ncbi:MAG: tol-pal system protein YbgF [Betaproteobacteria bacterium]